MLRRVLSRDLGTQFSAASRVMENARGALWTAVSGSLLAYVGVVSALVAGVIVYLSHHIAWPLRRLERFAEGLSRGDLRFNFHLRRHDQLRELTQALAEYRDHAAHQGRAVHHAVERIERRWADLGAAGPSEHAREAEKFLRFLADEADTIRTSLRPGRR